MKKVSEKMGVNAGDRAILIHAPEEAVAAIELPEVDAIQTLTGEFDYIHLFVSQQEQMRKDFPLLKTHLKQGGKLWVSWPKGGQLGTDLDIKKVIKIGYDFGLVESTALRIDAVWSGLKFTHPKKGKEYKNSYGKLKM